MIRLGKNKVNENFNILSNGTIVDLEGNVQEFSGSRRPCFKRVGVHQIQMWTNYGWRDTKIWAIHHLDENKENNSISNLVYMTRSQHSRYHATHRSEKTIKKILDYHKEKGSWNKGLKTSEEVRKKLSLSHIGKTTWIKGRNHSLETKKKLALVQTGKIGFTNGSKNIWVSKDEVPPKGFYRGITRKK